MGESCVAVVTQESISCGTLFGPLPLTSGSPDSLALLTWRCVDRITTSRQVLKVTPKEYPRGSSKPPAWLVHVQPARNPEEQTLEVVAKGNQLYYRALRDVAAGEELKTWFGEDLAGLLRLPLIPATLGEEGEKRYKCVLCNERFEHPFPVVAHFMYRCRSREGPTITDPVRKKNSGRVKNFDIATLTDMDDKKDEWKEEHASSLPLNVASSVLPVSSSRFHDSGGPRNGVSKKKKSESEDTSTTVSPKRQKTILDSKTSTELSEQKSEAQKSSMMQSSAFKITAASEMQAALSRLDGGDAITSVDGGNSSAFKKVDKSGAPPVSSPFHSLNSVSGLFSGSLPRRDLLFPPSLNSFSPFSYPLPPVTSSPPGGATLPAAMVSTVPHPVLSAPSDMNSAFAPATKLASGGPGLNPHHMKMSEEFKLSRQLAVAAAVENGFDTRTLLPPSVNATKLHDLSGLHYSKPFPPSMDNFAAKSFHTPLMSFLTPSLAALTFPTQNWCAKCNASFRMTSDLVYHMRSHHKKETDPQKMKREEKLRCQICQETFRERHHLTRHMTSHQ